MTLNLPVDNAPRSAKLRQKSLIVRLSTHRLKWTITMEGCRRKLHELMAGNLSKVLGRGGDERIAQAAVRIMSLRGQKGYDSG